MSAENGSLQAVGAAPGEVCANNESSQNSVVAQQPGNTSCEATLETFYSLIWPTSGIVTLFSLPDKKHHQCATIAEAVAKTFELDAKPDVQAVYHACASYKQPMVTDEKGKVQFRVQQNVDKCKALWADIDCGELKAATGKGYASKNIAHKELMRFLREYGLPPPNIIIDSGHGLHIYWALTEEIDAATWTHWATLLDLLFKAAKFLVDPSRTKDCSSVLRPPGTTNRKDPENPKPVTVKHCGGQISFEKFKSAIDAAATRHGIISTEGDERDATPNYIKGDTGNLSDFGSPEYPPSDAERVAEHCLQIKHLKETGGDYEPAWHLCAGVLMHCVGGKEYFHAWSAQYEGYDPQEAQGKLDNWTTGPATCAKFRELNPAGCAGCQHTCTSPIQLGCKPAWLAEMNAQYAWIAKPAAIYRKDHRDFIQMDKFHAAHANQTQPITSGRTTRDVSVSRLWLSHKDRGQFFNIVTRPGEPPVTSDCCLNDWAGFSVEACAGDVKPFMVLWEYLFGAETFPLQWVAHLLQKPGVKMFTALVVWSPEEGVGKNLLFETIGSLFNPHHFALLGQSEVDDDFCGWIPGVVFVVGDEIRASKSDKSRNRLKLWTTATTLRTHDKGTPKRVVDNLMNMVFLSNHADGMFLGDHDRRFYVHEVTAKPLPESIKQDFLRWRANGGLPHLLHYLQSIDLTGFDPKGRAPFTASKLNMIEAGRSDLDRWALDIVSGATPIGKEVVTAEEMNTRFINEFPHLRNPPPVATMGRVLVKMGAWRRDNQVRRTDGRKVRALALTRVDHWKDQPETAWRAELEKRA